jgi:hypothetical protein
VSDHLLRHSPLGIKLVAFSLIQFGESGPHTSMNGRSARFDDDEDLIVMMVTEPVEGHVEVNSTNINIENPLSITSTRIKHLNYKPILSLEVLP